MDANESDRRVAQRLRDLAAQRVLPPQADTLEFSKDEFIRLIYELDVHREELQLQNDELRLAHFELEATRDRYADLYDFAPVGYVTLDRQGVVVEANLTASEMLGCERSRLIGTPLAFYCETNSRVTFIEHLEDVFASGQRKTWELQLHATKSFYANLEMCRSFQSENGEHCCRIVITDMSERKRAQDLAREKDRHLRSLAEALPVLIGYLDSELRFQYVNAAYQEWFGAQEELTGRRIQDVHGDDFGHDVHAFYREALGGRRIEFEFVLTHVSQGRRPVEMMLVPDARPDGSVKGIHSLCTDITERKFIEDQAARRRSCEERLNRLTSEEREIYDLLVHGNGNQFVARQLDIGVRTVERRRKTIRKKLEVESITEFLQQFSDIQR